MFTAEYTVKEVLHNDEWFHKKLGHKKLVL